MPTEASGFLRGIAMASLRDNVALEASLGWFAGAGRDLVGRFSDSDFAYVRFKYFLLGSRSHFSRSRLMSHILLPAHNASTWTGPTGNNTYLLPGAVPTLIDAGVGKPEHVDAVAHALGGRPLALVLITHGHSDHVNGVPALVARWPDVRVRQFGAGNEPILDGEVIAAGDGAVTAIHTPGHAADHCCFPSARPSR